MKNESVKTILIVALLLAFAFISCESNIVSSDEGNEIFPRGIKGLSANFTGDRHWHGASPHSSLSQLYILPNTGKGMVNWMEPITDGQYRSDN